MILIEIVVLRFLLTSIPCLFLGFHLVEFLFIVGSIVGVTCMDYDWLFVFNNKTLLFDVIIDGPNLRARDEVNDIYASGVVYVG